MTLIRMDGPAPAVRPSSHPVARPGRSTGRYDASARQRYIERRALVDSIKMERGCIDCGYRTHPAALDFDHTDPSTKSWVIATNLSRRIERVLEEIAKCEVRCRNCHAIRTVTVEGANGLGAKTEGPASLFGSAS